MTGFTPVKPPVGSATRRRSPARDGSDADSCGPVVVNLADVQPESVRWLWPGRFALGKLTLLAGDPGLGKSFLTCHTLNEVGTPTGCRSSRFNDLTTITRILSFWI